MRKMVFLILSSFIFCLSACHHGASLHTVQGEEISLSSLNGKWIVLNYWSSWSESSKQEIAQLNELSHEFPANVVFLSHNYLLLPHESLSQVVSKYHIKLPVIKESMQQYYPLPKVTRLPVVYIINPEGKLAGVVKGARSAVEMKSLLVRLIRKFSHKTPAHRVSAENIRHRRAVVIRTHHQPLSSAQMV